MTTRRRDRCPYCGTPGNGEPCNPSCPPRQPPQTVTVTAEAIVQAINAREAASLEALLREVQEHPPGPATPGETAYAAYMAVLALSFPRDFAALPGTYRHAWEAAAQAVLGAWHAQEETPRCRWCGQPVALHPQDGEPWHCRLSDGPQLPKEENDA
jgi:hypothetical protein